MSYLVAALYKFVPLPEYEAMQLPLKTLLTEHQVKGILLLAPEGINGTLSGPEAGVRAVLAHLRAMPQFSDLEHKESWSERAPFARLKVRLKQAIVFMGVPGADPNQDVGTYVPPTDWNALIQDPETVLIDTRNDYEVKIGSFKHAIDPKTPSFSDFPAWVDEHRELLTGRKIAMFCTGGIRCERATAYLKEQGFDQVFHLKGGILRYLEMIPPEQSLWQGQCFVFDRRVSVGHGLVPGGLLTCGGCRAPLTSQDLESPQYEKGVCCPGCHDELTAEQKARFAERQKQIDLADARGEIHQVQAQS